MTKKTRILLVEDDTNLGFLIVDFLEQNGFDVKLYRDGESGLAGFKNSHFDFCILDLMLPKMDGFEVAKEIKKWKPTVPMMMLTARTMDEDKIRGFNIGIDDYMTKPFNEEELMCRIKAIISRTAMSPPEAIKEVDAYAIGKYKFVCRNQLLEGGTKERRLTKTENDILMVLCEEIGNVVPRNTVMQKVWGEEDYFIGRSLDVFVSKLRKYLAEDVAVKIESIPRVGLILSVEE